MAALPDEFLKKVTAEVATIKNVEDGQDILKPNDPQVVACARWAYSEIVREACRPFHFGVRNEIWDEYFGPLLLRSYPVNLPADLDNPLPGEPPTPIVIVDGETLGNTEWEIKKGRLVIQDSTTTTPQQAQYQDIEVTWSTGLPKAEDNPTLYTAILTQTLGNYHRRDALGLRETQGERGVSRTPSDTGGILDSVRSLIGSISYLGQGYSFDGE